MHSPDSLRHPFGALLAEQVRVVGLALSREAMLAGVALAGICFLTVMMGLRYDEQLDMMPEILQPTLLVALVLPYMVWKGDPVFGGAFLWTMPVRRQTAALAKVLAGAFWLMVAMLVTLVALSLAASTTGGTIGVSDVRLVGSEISNAARVSWTTPFWFWLVPFAGALLLYLLSSAALLGLRHPMRWVAGAVVAFIMLMLITVGFGHDGAFERAIEQLQGELLNGRYGLDFALTGGANSLAYEIRKPAPAMGHWTLWTSLPEAGRWAMAVVIWLGAVLLALALAIRRHWER